MWLHLFNFINYFGVVTNAFLIEFTSKFGSVYLKSKISKFMSIVAFGVSQVTRFCRQSVSPSRDSERNAWVPVAAARLMSSSEHQHRAPLDHEVRKRKQGRPDGAVGHLRARVPVAPRRSGRRNEDVSRPKILSTISPSSISPRIFEESNSLDD